MSNEIFMWTTPENPDPQPIFDEEDCVAREKAYWMDVRAEGAWTPVPHPFTRCDHYIPPRRCYMVTGHEGEHLVDPTEPEWIGLAPEVTE